MSDPRDRIGETGLRFFGKVTASVSHEIKNVFAVINENAGLLEDLMLLAAKGRPLDGGRLRDIVGTVIAQIRRGDGIVKSLNTFSHTVDDVSKTVDLGETLRLVATLFSRHASMKGVTVEVAIDGAVSVTTSPFALQNLIWLCLEFCLKAVSSRKRVDLRAKSTEEGALIRITGLNAEEPLQGFPGTCEKDLIASLGGKLSVDASVGEVVIHLPGAVASGKGSA